MENTSFFNPRFSFRSTWMKAIALIPSASVRNRLLSAIVEYGLNGVYTPTGNAAAEAIMVFVMADIDSEPGRIARPVPSLADEPVFSDDSYDSYDSYDDVADDDPYDDSDDGIDDDCDDDIDDDDDDEDYDDEPDDDYDDDIDDVDVNDETVGSGCEICTAYDQTAIVETIPTVSIGRKSRRRKSRSKKKKRRARRR